MGQAKIIETRECTSPLWAVQKAKAYVSLGEIEKTRDRYRGHPVRGVLVPECGGRKGGYIKGC